MSNGLRATKCPTLEEVAKHPAFPTAIWALEPHQSGLLPVAAGRGGPINISWEVHGDGPVKVVLISGLGFLKTSFQRQTLYFGHLNSEKYSVLILDNRGMGGSDKPLLRYSTSQMAQDIIEVLDHLSWTESRQLHVVGVSMGGMIAQELAYAIPERVCSLNLLCTAARIENTTGFFENMVNRITMLLPKSPDRTVQYTSRAIFAPGYLWQPDNCRVPDASMPRVRLPAGGKYGIFGTNYERFAAQEIYKHRDTASFNRRGFLLQLVAAAWHYKSPQQLRELGDRVGRERILVMHGTADGMISVPHGRKLVEYLQPGEGMIVEGMGHAPIVERTEWCNEVLEERFRKGEEMCGRGAVMN